jgi:hypothetical protein
MGIVCGNLASVSHHSAHRALRVQSPEQSVMCESDSWFTAEREIAMSQSSATETAPTAADLLHTVDAHWQAWVDVVDGIPEDQLNAETCGFWTTRDLLGHVAFWEDWGAEAVRLSLAGEAIPDEVGDLNQSEVDKHKHDSVADLKRYRAEAHDRLMTYLRSIQDEPTFVELVTGYSGEFHDHYDEHAAQVRQWRREHGM